jgi:hypothetical protein
MQVATTSPQTSRGLFAVGRDLAEVLAVLALHKASFSSVRLYLDDNMFRAIELDISRYFIFLFINVTRNRRKAST